MSAMIKNLISYVDSELILVDPFEMEFPNVIPDAL
jgi:hypothetical protein